MKNSAIPNAFTFSRPYLEQSPDSTFIGWHKSVRYEIYDDNDNPLWATHPKHGGAVDIAVFRTDIKPEDKVLTVNKALLQASEDREFELKPSLDVFMIGFPQGIAVGRHLPV